MPFLDPDRDEIPDGAIGDWQVRGADGRIVVEHATRADAFATAGGVHEASGETVYVIPWRWPRTASSGRSTRPGGYVLDPDDPAAHVFGDQPDRGLVLD